jgi:hypothetical protein
MIGQPGAYLAMSRGRRASMQDPHTPIGGPLAVSGFSICSML